DHQGRHADSVQPLAKPGIVHIGPPAIERGRLPIASDRAEFVITEPGVIRHNMSWIEEVAPEQFLAWKRVDIGDVAVFALTELDADRVDQHEPVDPLEAADAHFQRDPPAERR